MYAVLTMFTLGPGTRPIADKIGEQFMPVLKSFKGLKDVTFFSDDAAGEYGGLSLWETKEDAEACLAATGPKLEEALKDIVKGPPKRGVYEVWDM